MLTHRNKKPYECKAEGCGKSYCDARSLRRHTENHHASNKANETNNNSPSSPATGPNTPNTPGSNPSTPSTPGGTATTTTQNGHGHTALKQLLSSEPAPSQLKVCDFFIKGVSKLILPTVGKVGFSVIGFLYNSFMDKVNVGDVKEKLIKIYDKYNNESALLKNELTN